MQPLTAAPEAAQRPRSDEPTMNRLLIGILDLLNKLLAIFLVISSTVSGYFGTLDFLGPVVGGPGQRIVTTLIGLVIGLILAAIVSGVLATIITISREATAIHQLLLARIAAVPPDRPVV
jgi:hypothetical protein